MLASQVRSCEQEGKKVKRNFKCRKFNDLKNVRWPTKKIVDLGEDWGIGEKKVLKYLTEHWL